MNKNYRSIWNDALGAWVAVSEIETAKGKPAGSRVCSAKGGASVLKTVLRTIPLVLGMAFGLSSYTYASSGATVTTTTTAAGATETTQAPIIIGTLSTTAPVTAGTATLTGTWQSSNLYYNENPGNPYRDGLTSGTSLVLNNTSAGGVVIGNGASASNFGGLAIGGYASANQNYGMAFGAYSLVHILWCVLMVVLPSVPALWLLAETALPCNGKQLLQVTNHWLWARFLMQKVVLRLP